VGGTWAFEPLGHPGGPLKSGPAAVAWGPNRSNIEVVVRGPNDDVVRRAFNGSTWGPWTSLGGVTWDRPAITYTEGVAGRVDVFVRGTDDHLYDNAWIGFPGAFNGFTKVDDFRMTSGPGAVSWGPSRIDVFARGYNDNLFHTWWDGTRWVRGNNWESLGGVLLDGAPGAASSGPQRLEVYVQGTNRALFEKTFDGTSWGAFRQIADCMEHEPESWKGAPANTSVWARGMWSGSTASAAADASGTLHLVLWGADGKLWHDWFGFYVRENGPRPPACPCGAAAGQECCVGQYIGQSCGAPGVVCNQRPDRPPRCEPCGGYGQTCCTIGNSCATGSFCNDDRICAACGHDREPACNWGSPCVEPDLVVAAGHCRRKLPCGHAGEPRCDGERACGGDSDFDNAHLTLVDGLCVSCGVEGRRCCENAPDGACPGWDDDDGDGLQCVRGLCLRRGSSGGSGGAGQCWGLQTETECWGLVLICKDTYACPNGTTDEKTYPCGACFGFDW
jgi:hypothetical protein